MKFGIAVPNYGKLSGRDSILEVSTAAENLGFDSVWVSDHIVVPESHKGFGNIFYEPLATLSYIASITKKIKLGTSVIVLPYRNPITFSKSISTLDVLSGGRLIVGVGAGWLEEEFDALGVDYNERGLITDEYLEIVKELFIKDKPEFAGKYFNFKEINFYSKPLQKPYPPIWVGGSSKNALKRAVKYGTGWHAVGATPEVIKEKTEEITEIFEKEKKNAENFIISVRKSLQITDRKIQDNSELFRGDIQKIKDGLAVYKESGVDYIVFQVLSSKIDGVIKTMENFAEKAA